MKQQKTKFKKNKPVCFNEKSDLKIFDFLHLILGRPSRSRRQRRDTFTSADLLPPTHRSSISSSPIPITHSVSQHSSSQPSTMGYRRIYSPLTVDTTNLSAYEPTPRRYSASAAVSPPNHHLQIPSALNLIPPSPQDMLSYQSLRKTLDQQWHIPILLYSCKKLPLASTLLLSNEELLKTITMGEYVDCTKDENESNKSPVIPKAQNPKGRKRDNSRRLDDDQPILPDKLIEDMRDSMRESLDYAFATGIFQDKNCSFK